MNERKKVLVAPLDWGLGHATRCIPIIRALIERNCEVIIASNGRSLYLLEREFPNLKCLKLQGYDPLYPIQGSMVWKMAFQLPKFFRARMKEWWAVRKIVKDHDIDLIISDNRYGCWSGKAKSVFITHQVNILLPNKSEGGLVSSLQQGQIKNFDECWVPVNSSSIIPKLTTSANGIKTKPIGYLSRMEKKPTEKKYKLCVICSGPEPQREIFETMMEGAVKQTGYTSIIIRGKTEAMNPFYRKDDQCTIVNFFTSEEINQAIEESELVISRSGYSTVMDLMKLGAKAVLVPTPGQTEQEYIADQLMKDSVAYSMKQSEFDLERAIKESEKFKGFVNFEHDNNLLSKALDSVL